MIDATVDIVNPLDPSKRATVECVVDSGATYSIIPRPVLEGLGIRPIREDTFTVATRGRRAPERGSAGRGQGRWRRSRGSSRFQV